MARGNDSLRSSLGYEHGPCWSSLDGVRYGGQGKEAGDRGRLGRTVSGELNQLLENTLGPLVRHCEIGGAAARRI